ncbi:poly [ADP-ribose] polymerase tankyrase-1-like isoform X2 [Liolophura sinensis]|uniref:poly [ADP-ribose] polymerase tankyrase-1-like isoform X2 n=1 Tax=Liolophura sinensis TaxID=3198878 RepID=UPI0031595746
MDVDHGFFSNLFEAYNTSAVWKAMDSWYRASETVAVTSWGYALLYYDYIMSLLSNLIDRIPAYPIVKSLISPVTLPQLYAFLCGVCIMCSILVWLKIVPTAFDERKPQELDPVKESICSLYDVFDLAKTAYEKGHTEAVMKEVESRNLDVNMSVPISGLSLFMCACLSGHRRLIQYMTEQGGDPHCTSTQGDSPLYLATYGILNSPNGKPDFGALDELIDAGCSVNKSNHRGYTPLHRAASKGDLPLVNYLLMKGADPYRCNNSGIYPIDSAVSAGHKEVAQALRIDVANPHVWDVIEPHTPPHISLGLMSPHRRLMLESPAPKLPLMTLR